MTPLITAIRWSYHSGWLFSGPLLVVAVVAIWATPWLEGARPVSGLLTSVAQVLGTILALLFTISLVVAQMSFARSHRMLQPGIFGPWFRLYLILFVVSVAFPLLMLADSNGWLMINRPWVVLKTTLTLGSICLLFLMPYLAHMSNMMDPQFTIRLAQRQLRTRLSGSQVMDAQEVLGLAEFRVIEEIMLGALGSSDYNTLGEGFGLLEEIAADRSFTGRSHAVRDGF